MLHLAESYAMLRGWMVRLQGLEHAWASRLVKMARMPGELMADYYVRRRRFIKAAVADTVGPLTQHLLQRGVQLFGHWVRHTPAAPVLLFQASRLQVELGGPRWILRRGFQNRYELLLDMYLGLALHDLPFDRDEWRRCATEFVRHQCVMWRVPYRAARNIFDTPS
eukprot:6168020-Amphidinium_carterae.1